MNILSKFLSTICVSVLLCSTAQANLIQNGSFEDVGNSSTIGNYGRVNTWQVYSSIPNWDAAQNVEIWNNDFIVPAYDGDRVLELNAHPANANGEFSIFQTFDTVVGSVYELTFAGRKRIENSTESFAVSVGNFTDTIINQEFGQWNEYVYQFIATSSESTLTFTSLDGGRDTTGNILDAVSVTSIPEPSMLMLILLALSGMIISRRKDNS